MAQFFINRPKFAWVIAILLMIAGGLSFMELPVSAYPNIAPPQVTISASYPGASATTIEQTVTMPIEDEMSGITGLKSVSSTSSKNGTATVVLTFEAGTDTDIVGMDVQNKLKRVEANLPASVRQQGVSINKTRPDSLMILALFSPNNTYTDTDLADYIDNNIIREIRRINGVGSADLFAAKYAMRIWLDPKKMTSYGITPLDVTYAIKSQNAQLATGELGSLPSVEGQQINATIIVPARLSTVDNFSNIILRSASDGSLLKLRDIAKVERGPENYGIKIYLNRKEAAAFSTKLSNTGNALETAKAIKRKMNELKEFFPDDIEWMSPYDTSLFVDVAIDKVKETLIEAIILVTLVMFIFLQNWRSTIIPLIVVPVSLIGTGLGLYLFGFSINMLTLFAMVLAIGIVVDDAILVVENVERIMEEDRVSAYQATKKSMQQITGTIMGTTAVLVSVFVPMAFMSSSAGQIYKQFAVTIIVSVGLSAFFALSLTPAISQGLLKDKDIKPHPIIAFILKPLSILSDIFNKLFGWLTVAYIFIIKLTLTKLGVVVTLILFCFIIFSDYSMLKKLPKSFVPSEDQGFFIIGTLLPAGATQLRTKELTKKIDDWVLSQKEVSDIVTILGFGFLGNGQNVSISFVSLKPWEERIEKGMRTADEIVAVAGQELMIFSGEGMVFAANMPPIPGLGTESGFDLRLQDKGGNGNDALLSSAYQLVGMLSEAKDKVVGVRPNTLPPAPQLKIDIDRIKARTMGIDINELNTTLQVALGSTYVNDYIENSKVHQVWVQANPETRATVNSLLDLQVRNNTGGLVNLDEIATAKWIQGPAKLSRYNGFPSVPIIGSPATGVSSGQAMQVVENMVKKLPKGISYAWAGQSEEEIESASQANFVFAFSLVVIFLVLVALYESWAVPISVMLIIPIGIFGSLLMVFHEKLLNDVYFTVGLVTVVGLASKNAIVIVEFARNLQKEGLNVHNAVLEAAKIRFRPILMTSFAFILGVIPLMLAKGAGAASMNAIGYSVFGGMMTATLLGVFFVPVFYLVVRSIFPLKKSKQDLEDEKLSSKNQEDKLMTKEEVYFKVKNNHSGV